MRWSGVDDSSSAEGPLSVLKPAAADSRSGRLVCVAISRHCGTCSLVVGSRSRHRWVLDAIISSQSTSPSSADSSADSPHGGALPRREGDKQAQCVRSLSASLHKLDYAPSSLPSETGVSTGTGRLVLPDGAGVFLHAGTSPLCEFNPGPVIGSMSRQSDQ
jgi:hypothetical protein